MSTLSTRPADEDYDSCIKDEFGVVYSADGQRLLKCINNELENYVIKEGTETICDDAFRFCHCLKQITIPDSVKNIGEMIFVECKSLRQITIPAAVTRIRQNTFNNCSSLQQITIPDSVKMIEDYAFGGCSSIREIVSDIDKLFTITDDVFHADVKSQATLYVPIGSKSTYESTNYWLNFTHDNIEEGKWLQTTSPDEHYLKYRYHTGKKKASVIEIIFPENNETTLAIPSTFTLGEAPNAVTYDIEAISPSVFNNIDKVQTLTIENAVEGYQGVQAYRQSICRQV